MTYQNAALNALIDYQQADEEGVMVLASRQAIHEVHEAYLKQAARIQELEEENARLSSVINAPENDDFIRGVSIESEHQRQRWSAEHDGSKNGWDWFWTIGYLSQKAAAAFESGDFDKAKHHCISTAALMKTFHGYVEARAALPPTTEGEKT